MEIPRRAQGTSSGYTAVLWEKKGILGSGSVIWVITGFGVGKPQGQLFMEHWLWGQALITCLALFYGSSARLMMVTSSG